MENILQQFHEFLRGIKEGSYTPDIILQPIAVLIVLALIWLLSPSLFRNVLSTWSNPVSPNIPGLTALHNFQWWKETPLQYRPFKPKYHLTMGIQNLDPNDLILIDSTFKSRLDIRRKLLSEHKNHIIGINNSDDGRISAAIRELYHQIIGTYLPARYPTIFTRESSGLVRNTVTNELCPLQASAEKALEILLRNVDEDFFILLPHQATSKHRSRVEADNDDDEKTQYFLEAYSACFPSGFQPEHKLGLRLSSIHGPLPGYKDKLQKSMDRFFNRLQTGRYVKRVNWSITVDEDLYSNFDKSGVAMTGKEKQMHMDELDLKKTFLRCERQTLHRLPQTKAIVFAFHTYQYPIEQIKHEGLGEELATAIDGLKKGSTPAIFTYKNGHKWGEAVKEYLRS